MITYLYPSLIFRKEWHWFTSPGGKSSAALVNYFAYEDIEAPDFKKKAGLTTIVDLTKSTEELWANMRKKFICEQINKGNRNGIEIKLNDDWRRFAQIYATFREGKRISHDDARVFKNCLVVGAYYEGKHIAGGAFICDDRSMRALALASLRFVGNAKMREIIGQANRIVIWETMKHAKKWGILTFDLGGIDPDGDSGERSLAEFKEGFGGERRMGYYYSKVNSKLLQLWITLLRNFR